MATYLMATYLTATYLIAACLMATYLMATYPIAAYLIAGPGILRRHAELRYLLLLWWLEDARRSRPVRPNAASSKYGIMASSSTE
jgi:hypothetical protein